MFPLILEQYASPAIERLVASYLREREMEYDGDVGLEQLAYLNPHRRNLVSAFDKDGSGVHQLRREG